MHSKKGTYDTGHGASLLKIAKEHFFLVEHLSGLMLCFLWMDEDRTKEVCCSVSHPHLLNPVKWKEIFDKLENMQSLYDLKTYFQHNIATMLSLLAPSNPHVLRLSLKPCNNTTAFTLPAHSVAHQSMWSNVYTVSHFKPKVVVAELLIVLTPWLPIGHIHWNILPFLQTHRKWFCHIHLHVSDVNSAKFYRNNCNWHVYLVNNDICDFAFLCRLWFLVMFGGKHGCHSDDRKGYLSRNEPNRAQGHRPHLDLLERLALGRVAWLTDIDILCSEAFWVKFEVLLNSHPPQNIWSPLKTSKQQWFNNQYQNVSLK